MKKNLRRVLTVAIILVTILVSAVQAPHAYAVIEGGEYLKAAQTKYKVPDDRVMMIESISNLKDVLADAGKIATVKSKVIVYVPAGTWSVTDGNFIVPSNVVLVAEKNTIFNAEMPEGAKSGFERFFKVSGCVYGGTYKCNNQMTYGLMFNNEEFANKNGQIEYAVIQDAVKFGVVATSPSTTEASLIKKANINYCEVSGCGLGGIAVMQGAWVHGIQYNYIHDNKGTNGNGSPGINLSKGWVNKLAENTITNNSGHGISTDVDGNFTGFNKCIIKQLMGNTITNNGYHGVYLDKKCYVQDTFSRNVISNNKKGGLVLDPGAWAKTIAKNTFDGNGKDGSGSNILVLGKKSEAIIGNSNTIKNAGYNNIYATQGGYVEIMGKNNTITGAKNVGISVNKQSKLKITGGKNNVVTNNGGYGLRGADASTINIKNVTFKGNYGGAAIQARVSADCTLSYSGCNLSKKKTAEYRIIVE